MFSAMPETRPPQRPLLPAWVPWLALAVGGAYLLSRRKKGDQDEPLPPGRGLECDVLDGMEEEYAGSVILDNPEYLDEESFFCPDVVVETQHGVPLAVREAKDVAVLTPAHVLQAAHYDNELEPRDGTTLDIDGDTYVPDVVAELAETMGIDIERWGD